MAKKDLKVLIISLLFLLFIILYFIIIPILSLGHIEESEIYIDTKQNDHFIFHEYFSSFPDIECYYRIYEYNNSQKKEIPPSGFYSKTKLTKDKILNNIKYTEYYYKNRKVKIYSDNHNSKLIYKTSKDTNYTFAKNNSFAYDLITDDKLPDIISIKNNYTYLVPFYRNVLKSHNKNKFFISAVFLIFMDDIESFCEISESINLIEPKKQHYFLNYINNYPNSKKDKYIIVQQIDTGILKNIKF